MVHFLVAYEQPSDVAAFDRQVLAQRVDVVPIEESDQVIGLRASIRSTIIELEVL